MQKVTSPAASNRLFMDRVVGCLVRMRSLAKARFHSTKIRRVMPSGAHLSFEPARIQTPSTKPQAPKKFQISNHQTPKTDVGNGARVIFELGAGCFFGAWSLEFGA